MKQQPAEMAHLPSQRPRRSRSLPWRILVAVLVGLFLVPIFFDKVGFLIRSVPATGTVIAVTPENSRCTDAFAKHSRDCTKFSAVIEYQATDHSKHRARLSAGDARNHDRPLLEAALQPSMTVRIRYDPTKFWRVSYDSFWEGWGSTLCQMLAFIAGLIFLFSRRARELLAKPIPPASHP